MKPKTAITLGVLLLLCLGYIVVRLVASSRQPPADDGEPKALFKAPVTRCRSVTIVDSSGPDITVVLRDGRWYLTEPVQARADRDVIDTIVATVGGLKGRVVENPAADVTGLDAPLWTVTLEAADGEQNVLTIGRQSPALGTSRPQTYVRTPDGTVHTVEQNLSAILTRPVNRYRDLAIMNVPAETVRRITVVGKESYEVEKIDGSWRFVKPFNAGAMDDAVKALIDRAAFVIASQPADVPPDQIDRVKLSEDEAALLLTLWTVPDDAEPPAASAPATAPALKKHTLTLGLTVGDKVYAAASDRRGAFLVAKSMLELLQPELASLRDRNLFDVDPQDVRRITIDRGARQVVLANVDNRWRVEKPYQAPANARAVARAFRAMAPLRVQGFRDNTASLAPFGLQPPEATVVLAVQNSDDQPALHIGLRTSAASRLRYVRNAAEATVGIVSEDVIAPLLADPAAWHDPMIVLPLSPRPNRLVLQRGGKTFTVRSDPDGNGWSLLTPVKAPAETRTVATILRTVSPLSTSEIVFVGEKLPNRFQRAKNRVQLSIYRDGAPASTQPTAMTQPAPKLLAVVNVAKSEDGVFAWRTGANPQTVGKCDDDLWETLTQELRNRDVWRFAVDDVVGFRLDDGVKTLELRAEGDQWKYAADPYVKIDAAKVITFLNEIHSGRADVFVEHKTVNTDGYRLNKPWFTFEVSFKDGRTLRIVVSHTGVSDKTNRFATATGTEGVFAIPAKLAGKMITTLDAFKPSAGPKRPKGPGGLPGPIPLK